MLKRKRKKVIKTKQANKQNMYNVITFMHLYGSTSMYVKKNSSKFHRNEKINQSFLYR